MIGIRNWFCSSRVRANLLLGLSAITLFLASSSCRIHAAAIYAIDINRANNPLTEVGWTALNVDATDANANSSFVVIDGINFQIYSADGARTRLTGVNPNPNALTADFAFDDGSGQAVGMRLGLSTAASPGTLARGLWLVEVWSYDATSAAGTQIIGTSQIKNGVSLGETIRSTTVTPHATDPALTFSLLADGVSYYSVFTRENNANDRSRLNAVRLTHLIPEPTSIALMLLGMVGAVRFRLR